MRGRRLAGGERQLRGRTSPFRDEGGKVWNRRDWAIPRGKWFEPVDVDPAPEWRGPAPPESTMTTENPVPSRQLIKGGGRALRSEGQPCPRKPSTVQVKSIVSCGRVEDGRGSLGPMANAPFPTPAHRTGRAALPHPALRLASP
jgi:hypothetical protein